MPLNPLNTALQAARARLEACCIRVLPQDDVSLCSTTKRRRNNWPVSAAPPEDEGKRANGQLSGGTA